MKVHNLVVTGSLTSGGENISTISSSVASTVTNVSSSVSTSIAQLSSSMASTMTSLSSSLTSSMGSLSSSMVSVMATTGSNLFKGNQTISGSIIPAVNNTYDLGSATHQFRDLYLSSASLYIDGVKVLGSTAQELQITTDGGQSFKILEAGSDTITLQSADGNITLATSGGGDVILDPTTGIIALKGTTTVYAGNKILSSDGNAIHFGNSVTMTGSLIVSGFIETQELRTTYISSSILYRSGSTKFGDELTDTHAFTGSLLISGGISVPGSGLVSGSSQITYSSLSGVPSGIISGSAQVISSLPGGTISGSVQVDVMSTTNIARLATTGSNTFTSNQIVTGSISSTGNIRTDGVVNWNGTIGALSYGGGTVTMETNTAVPILLKTNGTTAITISTGQTVNFANNVGLGVSSPLTKLHLQGSSPNYILLTNTAADGVQNAIQGGIIGQSRGYSNNLSQMASILFRNENSAAWYKGEITFNTNGSDGTNPAVSPTERLRISSGGNIGINEAAPSKILTVNFGTSSSDGLLVTGVQRQETRFKSTGEHSNVFIDSAHSNIYLPTLALLRSGTSFGEVKLQRASNSDSVGSYTESEMIMGSTTTVPVSIKTNEVRRILVESGGIVNIYNQLNQRSGLRMNNGTGGSSPRITFGTEDESAPGNKSIYLDNYWMILQPHVNEGLRVRFVNGSGTQTETVRLQSTHASFYTSISSSSSISASGNLTARNFSRNIKSWAPAGSTGSYTIVTYNWADELAALSGNFDSAGYYKGFIRSGNGAHYNGYHFDILVGSIGYGGNSLQFKVQNITPAHSPWVGGCGPTPFGTIDNTSFEHRNNPCGEYLELFITKLGG